MLCEPTVNEEGPRVATSMPNTAAISRQVSGPCPSRARSASASEMRW